MQGMKPKNKHFPSIKEITLSHGSGNKQKLRMNTEKDRDFP